MDDSIKFLLDSIINGSLDGFIINTARENLVSGCILYYILKRLAKDTDWAPNDEIMEMVMGLVSKRKRLKNKEKTTQLLASTPKEEVIVE